MPKEVVGSGKYSNPYMTKDIAHIIFKVMLLHRIKKKAGVYSYALIKEFNSPKISMFLKKDDVGVKNDIYNTMKMLEKSGYIKLKSKVESGRLKKYYYITTNGERALYECKALFMRSMKELNEIVR